MRRTALDAPAGAQRASGDTTGRHCSSVAVYAQEGDAMVLTVRLVPEPSAPARFGLGHPGDVLLLGDWDCDGLDTAALYRPVSGEVRYFDDWAPAGAPSRSSRDDRLPAGIEPRVVGDATGCDALAGPT